MHTPSRRKLIVGLSVAGLVAIAVGWGAWALWRKLPADVDELPALDSDTGMTRTQTEEMMRSIGYVQ